MFRRTQSGDLPWRSELGVLVALACVLCVGSRVAESQDRAEAGSEQATLPQSTGGLSGIGPRADRILREMSEYLKTAREFTFHADVAYDSVLPSGQKIQYGGAVDVAVRRPDRLRAEYRGDQRKRRAVYDGRKFTVNDLAANVYTVTEVPPEIGAAVDTVFEKYGFSAPLADFVYADVYRALMENARTGFLVGEHSVDGTPCQHLAFSQESIDWQIWIEDGPRPLPRKFLITYLKCSCQICKKRLA